MQLTHIHEDDLRNQLVRSAIQLRSALARCPALDYLTDDARQLAVAQIEEATTAYGELTTVTAALRALVGLSAEAVYVLASSEMALHVAGEALALITAQIDASEAA